MKVASEERQKRARMAGSAARREARRTSPFSVTKAMKAPLTGGSVVMPSLEVPLKRQTWLLSRSSQR